MEKLNKMSMLWSNGYQQAEDAWVDSRTNQIYRTTTEAYKALRKELKRRKIK